MWSCGLYNATWLAVRLRVAIPWLMSIYWDRETGFGKIVRLHFVVRNAIRRSCVQLLGDTGLLQNKTGFRGETELRGKTGIQGNK